MKAFFDYHVERIADKPVCMNCGCYLKPVAHHVAHILPKSKCKSVGNNMDNALYLCTTLFGGGGCHDRFDRDQNTVAGVKSALAGCMDVAMRKFAKFRGHVAETSRREFMVMDEVYGEWLNNQK